MKMTQRGMNDIYPDEIETWKLGDKIPEWLSDKAQVIFIDGEGNLTLNIRDLNSGGKEIIGSDGKSILVKMETPKSLVCYSPRRPIFSLRQEQIDLLYESEE
jgi:hypothetical protein